MEDRRPDSATLVRVDARQSAAVDDCCWREPRLDLTSSMLPPRHAHGTHQPSPRSLHDGVIFVLVSVYFSFQFWLTH